MCDHGGGAYGNGQGRNRKGLNGKNKLGGRDRADRRSRAGEIGKGMKGRERVERAEGGYYGQANGVDSEKEDSQRNMPKKDAETYRGSGTPNSWYKRRRALLHRVCGHVPVRSSSTTAFHNHASSRPRPSHSQKRHGRQDMINEARIDAREHRSAPASSQARSIPESLARFLTRLRQPRDECLDGRKLCKRQAEIAANERQAERPAKWEIVDVEGQIGIQTCWEGRASEWERGRRAGHRRSCMEGDGNRSA
ncbi:hypothetical protein C8R47DRAFT_1066555 [Mycena vitilis]|nr:hypothetical protein C8R47DRAFT_1066555 [Mycena vitilis]